MQAGAGNQLRQHGVIADRLRLRPAESERILEHSVDQHRDEEQGDEVHEQTGHDLIDRKAQAQPQRNENQDHACDGTDKQQQGNKSRSGEIAKQLGTCCGNRDGTEIELTLGADVPEPCPEGDGGGKPS